MDFDDFFTSYDLESIKDTFLENEFSSLLGLAEVTDDDLKEMGIKALGKRRQFMAAVKDVTRKKLKAENAELQLLNTCTTAEIQDRPETSQESMEKVEMNRSIEKPTSKKKLLVDFNQSEDEMCTPPKQSTSKIQSSQKYGKQSGIQSWLQSPFDEEKVLKSKKISLHTASEIKKVYGLRRKKMEFMNSKLKELIKDPAVRGQNKTTIIGMAEVAWDRYNALDASIDVIEVDSLIAALEKRGQTFNEKQTKTIRKVTERVNRAQSDIKSQLRRIKDIKEDSEIDEKEKNRKIAKEEDELTIMHHELQKGTDSLRKACCIKIVQLQKLLQTINEPENSDNGNESDVSASSIVEDILDQGLGENGKDDCVGENKIIDHNEDEEEDEDEELEKL